MLYQQAMKNVGCRIPLNHYEAMKKYCEKHSLTMSEFVRLAIASFLNL